MGEFEERWMINKTERARTVARDRPTIAASRQSGGGKGRKALDERTLATRAATHAAKRIAARPKMRPNWYTQFVQAATIIGTDLRLVNKNLVVAPL
jgi:hypothetical protein